jgi:hypothetical protein
MEETNIVKPKIRRNQGSIANNESPDCVVNTERTMSRENRWSGSESCIFVMSELSDTTTGSCATTWIFVIVKICVEPPGATQNSPERSRYLIHFRRWSGLVTISGNEVLETTNWSNPP